MFAIQHVGGGYTRDRAIREIADKQLWPYSLHAAAGSTYPFHHHRTDETLYLIEGELVFKEEDPDRELLVKAGDRILVPAGRRHTVRALADTTYIMALRDFIPIEEFPIWDEPANSTDFFETLARQFAEAEQYPAQLRDYSSTLSQQLPRNLETGEEFYRRLLAPALRFRRAGGPPPIGVATFLQGLTNVDNTTGEIAVSDVEVIEYSRNLVLVALMVRLTGRRGGAEIQGRRFRNIRVFVRDPGEWRCALWFNVPE